MEHDSNNFNKKKKVSFSQNHSVHTYSYNLKNNNRDFLKKHPTKKNIKIKSILIKKLIDFSNNSSFSNNNFGNSIEKKK